MSVEVTKKQKKSKKSKKIKKIKKKSKDLYFGRAVRSSSLGGRID
jgi:hypothetical protein